MAEIVSFASGKGGVGKTLLTAALGIFLSRKGKKVLLIDGDMGMRNMDLVLGLENECFYHVMDLAEGRCFAKDVILEVNDHLDFLPAAQNIDGLHQRAGSRNVIEVHGTILTNTCEKCFATYDAKTLLTLASPVPHCPSCGGVIKPDVVLYEEALDANDIDEAIDEISKADMLIIGGTSLVVYPAAGFVTYFRGDALVVINQDATPQDDRADLVFHESVGKVLEMAVEGD